MQYFCGEKYFRHEFPIDPSSMTKWCNKVGIATTAKNNFIVGALGFDGNPFDGHTLRSNLAQTMKLIDHKILKDVYVDDYFAESWLSSTSDVKRQLGDLNMDDNVDLADFTIMATTITMAD